MGQARRRAAESEQGRKATRRIVLERVQVLVVPADVEVADPALLEALGPLREAWVDRGLFDGMKPVNAIEAYVKPGTPEQKTGEFRAPPVQAWKGGARFSQPTLPKVERELL